MKGERIWLGLGIAVLFGLFLYGCAVGTQTTPPDRQLRAEDLRVTEFGMFPSPVYEGQRIRFNATLFNRSPNSGRVRVMIKDRDQVVTEVFDVHLHRLGNAIQFPLTSYRFHGRDHCFTVLVDVAGTYQSIDLARRFCAVREGNGWILAGQP